MSTALILTPPDFQTFLRSCQVLSKISNDSALQKNNSLEPISDAFGLKKKDADFKLRNTFGQYFTKTDQCA